MLDNITVIPIQVITVHVTESMLKDLARLVKQKKYANRSEAIRVAIRDLIRLELLADGEILEVK